MVIARKFVDNAPVATLTATLNSTATTFSVASAVGFPTAYPFSATLDIGLPSSETILVTGITGTTVTCVRNVNGLGAYAHTGATLTHTATAQDLQEANDHHVAVGGGLHGRTGALVGTSDTQTLTNKTLTAPTLTGTVGGTPLFASTLVSSAGVQATGGHIGGIYVVEDRPRAIQFKGAGAQAAGTTSAPALIVNFVSQYDPSSADGTFTIANDVAGAKLIFNAAGYYKVSGRLAVDNVGLNQTAGFNVFANTTGIYSTRGLQSGAYVSMVMPPRVQRFEVNDYLQVSFSSSDAAGKLDTSGHDSYFLVERVSS